MAEIRWFKTMKEYSDYVKAAGKGRAGEEFEVKELTEEKPKAKTKTKANKSKEGWKDE